MRDKLRNICLIVFVISIMLCIVSISYGYFKPVVDNIEDRTTIKLDGAEIYANYSSTSTIYVEDIEPSDGVIGYKDFSLEVKNTSSRDVSAYIYLDIIYSDYTDIENDGVLYYELVSDGNIIVDKTMIKAVSSGKALLSELVIPSNTSSTTINYRLNIYFPLSDKIQNLNKGEDGTMKFNGKIEVMNESLSLKNYISKLDMEENGLEYDDFGNLRYVGSNPNNYITFNDETWRIIGIVDGYVKIIRQDRIVDAEGNDSFMWNINFGNKYYSKNDWTIATLQKYLNNEYYKSLTENAQLNIQEVTWKLGGMPDNNSDEQPEKYDIKYVYNQERGEEVYSGMPIEWTGKIALMYASDYGYANNSEMCTSNLRSSHYIDLEFEDGVFRNVLSGYCEESNWLYLNIPYSYNETTNSIKCNSIEWLLNPSSSSYFFAFRITWGQLSNVNNHIFEKWKVRPTLHLTNETTRVSGTGTSLDPYIIQ